LWIGGSLAGGVDSRSPRDEGEKVEPLMAMLVAETVGQKEDEEHHEKFETGQSAMATLFFVSWTLLDTCLSSCDLHTVFF
jgi:hypothetical protein